MNIPSAKQSPRIEHGVLKWYRGDTFDLHIELDMVDQDGVPIEASGTVDMVFSDGCNVVKSFTLTPNENIITVDFNADVSALFPAGEYFYDMYYNGTERTTIVNNNKVVVE